MLFTVSGLHHIGPTDRDVGRSLAWCRRMLEPGPVNHGEGAALSPALQVDGVTLPFAMVEIGDTRVELLRYHEPPGRDFDHTDGDVGSAHVCLEAGDVTAAYADLTAKGAVFDAPPSR